MIQDYEKQVYTSLLGKIIGVYIGRPIEGWSKENIKAEWGMIERYVHDDRNVPLVVPDDDISGTITFVRALEDSGLYADTPDDFYGKTWLNYLLEDKTILWWGGMGNSTEHTAYLRLKQGIPSPRSGSAELNGKVVAEQIGAQIFIDAFGMVAPGNPALAVQLAKKAASVSHDGEAVIAAQLVAAMVSIAFVEKDMEKILDSALKFIPSESMIAQIHRDVRKWACEDSDWEKTYERIKEKYGYQIYGGNCHVIPNHAIMVMAWAYAQNDFFKAMSIINTAGWDTDCNAANVGSVSALVAGLEHICDVYDFRTPFADRIILPTADGTDSSADVLREALKIASVGRRIMNMPEVESPKKGAWHHFEMPGALHGYMTDNSFEDTKITNIEAPEGFRGTRCMSIRFKNGKTCIKTPVCPISGSSSYNIVGTPTLYNGMTLRATGKAAEVTAPVKLRMFFVMAPDKEGNSLPNTLYSDSMTLENEMPFETDWTISGCETNTIVDFGFEIESSGEGTLLIDSVDYGNKVSMEYPHNLNHIPSGWISSVDNYRCHFSEDIMKFTYIGKNEDCGILLTGNRSWKDVAIKTNVKIHMAEEAGILLRYQGMQRYYALIFTRDAVKIVRNYYGLEILAEKEFNTEFDRVYSLEVTVCDDVITMFVDGENLLCVNDSTLKNGAGGFYVHTGLFGFYGTSINAQI